MLKQTAALRLASSMLASPQEGHKRKSLGAPLSVLLWLAPVFRPFATQTPTPSPRFRPKKPLKIGLPGSQKRQE
jgi:hypothetical protein